jgi:spore coat polysaccharide biosynthesis protein SpsF (cytidylyltransferase family)
MVQNIVAIIQARVGSTRLPNKINLDLHGKTVLQRVVNRVAKSKHMETICLAMPNTIMDSKTLRGMGGVEGFLGSEADVLSRYYKCATEFNADIIVRITADCPLIDPFVIDRTVGFYMNNDYDYVSNRLERPGYPDGQDVEVFSMRALNTADQFAYEPSDREHVTPWIKRHFKCGALHSYTDLMDVRMTLDTYEDYQQIKGTVGKLIDKYGEITWNLKQIMEEMDADNS